VSQDARFRARRASRGRVLAVVVDVAMFVVAVVGVDFPLDNAPQAAKVIRHNEVVAHAALHDVILL